MIVGTVEYLSKEGNLLETPRNREKLYNGNGDDGVLLLPLGEVKQFQCPKATPLCIEGHLNKSK